MAAVLAVLAVVGGGLWLFAGVLAPDSIDIGGSGISGYWTSVIFGVVWFVLASVAFGQITKRRPDLKWPVRGTFLVCAIAAGVVFVATSLVDSTADDDTSEFQNLPAAAPAQPGGDQPGQPAQPAGDVRELEGAFEQIDHGAASGKATVVRLKSGERRLVIDDLAVDNGPDLRVYLTPATDGVNVDGSEDLGDLKGNKGDQVYTIPKDVDLAKHKAVVIWCRAFSVGFAVAELKPAG